MPVTGFLGGGLVNSFHGGDGTTGTLTSPAFIVDAPFLSFLVGGGAHAQPPPQQQGQAGSTGQTASRFAQGEVDLAPGFA